MPRPAPGFAHDIHSYANPELVRVRHLNLDLEVVFEQQTIQGTAILTIEQSGRDAKQLILDSRALQIDETEVSPDGAEISGSAVLHRQSRIKILGAPLRIDIAPDTKFVKIRYSTDPTATALQWLAPGADSRQAASVPLHAIAGDSRAQLDSAAGFSRRPRHV